MADAPEPTRISAERGWTPPSIERLQEVLPAYEVIELLGAGGMGAVYKARQKSLKRLVAIKILPTAGADDDFQFVERFRNEAETLAQMNHPAIVNVYDFGETPNGLLYFVMEFVDGTDVHKMIQSSGKLSAEHALSITAHVCDALAYAHRHGVIHRDIKPANILIDREGHVKVADFGLAKMHDPSQTSGLTRTNMTMGTPDYAAPEVFKPGMVTDHRADLYAVGVMLYQMLTGEVPRGFFKLPSEGGTDPRFDAIIVKAMEANRDERFQSALEVRHALDEILTTPLAKDDGTGVISARSLPQRSRVTPQPAPSSKAKWFAAAAIVAVLGGAGFFLLGGKDEPLAKTQPPARERPASPAPVPEKGRTIDLLALVDVKRDAIVGEWSRSPGGVAVAIPAGASVLQLPYRPPEEYDFEIEFTPSNAGLNVNQYLSAGERSFAWKLNAHNRTPPLYGFELLDGKFCKDLTEAAANIATAIEPGRRYQSVVEVRRGGLRGLLDGKEIVKWSGDFRRFSMEGVTRLRDDEHLGIGSWKRNVTFHKVEVREITGAGKMDVRPASTGVPTIRAWLDGRFVAETREDTFKEGTAGAAFTKWSVVEKVEIAELAATTTAAPPSANWQDLTALMREKASGRAGLVVDPDAVRQTGGDAPVSMQLVGSEMRDRMVRVRYVGEVQVSLWPAAGGGGSAFVLAQRERTMVLHQDSPTSAVVALLPAVPHPPGFDPAQPHELLVTVQGAKLRAWIDDRFIGEVEADAIKDTTTGLNFTKASAVQKVEVAELTAAASTDWQPVFTKPEDFGGDLRDVEFRDGATFLKGRSVFAPLRSAEGAIRGTLRYFEADRTGSLTIRATDAPYGQESFACTAFVSAKGTNVAIHLRDKTAGIVEPQRTDFPLAPAILEGKLFTMELAAENGQVTVRVNGRDIGKVKDLWKGGNRRFGITPSNTAATEFRDVAVKASSGAVK